MSWKDYQHNLERPKRAKRGWGKCFWGLVCVISFSGLVLGVSSVDWAGIVQASPKVLPEPDAQVPIEAVSVRAQKVKVFTQGRDVTLDLSLDQDLQKFIDRKLSKYGLDWAGVAVMEPDTGRVLALSSFSSKDPSAQMLPLQATFPAASIFKVVTAGALLEETAKSSTSVFRYAGDMRRIHKRYLSLDNKGTSMTLSNAFAKSANGIFGVIGSQYLDAALLQDYAQRFGFNQKIPFDLPIEMSRLEIPSQDASQVVVAKLAAGFGKVTLSPLHGAMIASSVIMDGQMMKPTLVDRVMEQETVLTQTQPEVWKSPFSKENAQDMRSMMQTTVDKGTARKSFRHHKTQKVLRDLEIGGKTGSLYGKSPKGRNEWFISYASDPKTNKKLAIGVVIVNQKYWKIKPAQLAQWIYKEYFSAQSTPSVLADRGALEGAHGS